MFTTRRRCLLALPACRSWRTGARQLNAAAVLSRSLAAASEEAWGASRRRCAAGSILAGCWRCRYAARRVTRPDSSLPQAVLSRPMARAAAEATRWPFIATVDSFVFTTHRRRLPACRLLSGEVDSSMLQAMPSLSMAVASEKRLVATVCFVLSTRRRRDCWRCRYAARDVTRLDGSLRQTMLSPSMTRASAESTLCLFIVAVGSFMFTARRR